MGLIRGKTEGGRERDREREGGGGREEERERGLAVLAGVNARGLKEIGFLLMAQKSLTHGENNA